MKKKDILDLLKVDPNAAVAFRPKAHHREPCLVRGLRVDRDDYLCWTEERKAGLWVPQAGCAPLQRMCTVDEAEAHFDLIRKVRERRAEERDLVNQDVRRALARLRSRGVSAYQDGSGRRVVLEIDEVNKLVERLDEVRS